MIIQAYASTTDEDEGVDEFYGGVQSEINRTRKQDVLFVVIGWNAKIGNSKEEK